MAAATVSSMGAKCSRYGRTVIANGSGGGVRPGDDSSVKKPADLPPMIGLQVATSASVSPSADNCETRSVRFTTSGMVLMSTNGTDTGSGCWRALHVAYWSRVIREICSDAPRVMTTA